jgi:hypothetical protein
MNILLRSSLIHLYQAGRVANMIPTDFFRILSISRNNKIIFFTFSVVIVALIVDTSITKISDLVGSLQNDPSWRLSVFIIIATAYAIAQYIILKFIKTNSNEIRSKEKGLHLNVIHKIVTTVQYLLTAILIFVIVQMIVTSVYNVVFIVASTMISYGLAITILGILAQRFLLWFKSNRNFVVLSYGLSSVMLSINSALTFILVSHILLDKPTEVTQSYIASNPPFFIAGSAMTMLYSAYVITSILSFVAIWIATTLLLRHYSKRLGTIKYWIMLSIPLIYFLSQFLSLFLNVFILLFKPNPIFFGVFFTLIFSLSKPVGGILFGVAFLTIARSISQQSIVRNYMYISAYGLVLSFVSNEAIVLVDAPYPPFGLSTISFMGLSSYLILVGIYSSAISVSEDSKLRQSIRRFAMDESKLLDSIGSAQLEQEILRKAMPILKKQQSNIKEETGVQSSLTEEDMKQYLEEVLLEIGHKSG